MEVSYQTQNLKWWVTVCHLFIQLLKLKLKLWDYVLYYSDELTQFNWVEMKKVGMGINFLQANDD